MENINPLVKYYDDEDAVAIPGKKRLLMTIIYLISTILSYLILLLVFQLDAGIFFFTVAGYSVGYIVFGFRRRKSYYFLYNPKSDKC